ncbi:ABC transporter permease [Brevibacillus borstelensis]|uniref:ABC transporter permease n=1 Tax=Brevibacillus borstelensis TaxID=45462 RepID=UPI0030C5760D
MKAVGLEFYKLRRKRVLLMIVLFLTVELGWAFVSAGMAISRNPEKAGWEGVLVTIASMNGLFLPILSAVVVSRICDMEHTGNTWKLLMAASFKRSGIYAAKYACACLLLLLFIILQSMAILCFGIANGFEQSFPLSLLLRFAAGTMLASLAVIALQQWISFSVKNQAFGLGLGMIGGFIGMAADLFPEAVRRIFIWSYYTGLSPISYKYENETMEFVTRGFEPYLPAAALLIGAAVYLIGSIHASRQEE